MPAGPPAMWSKQWRTSPSRGRETPTSTPTTSRTNDDPKTFDGAGSVIKFEYGDIQYVDDSWTDVPYTPGYFGAEAPLIFASMQTTNEADTAALRFRNSPSSTVQLSVQEEDSDDLGDSEHGNETAGFLAIQAGDIWVDINRRRGNSTTSWTQRRRPARR